MKSQALIAAFAFAAFSGAAVAQECSPQNWKACKGKPWVIGSSMDTPIGDKWWPHKLWGANDEAGATNWYTRTDVVMRALAEAKQGKVYRLGRPYTSTQPGFGGRQFVMRIVGTPTGGPFGANMLVYHDEFVATEIGQTGTQFDGLGHIGTIIGNETVYYNGFKQSEVGGAYGLQKLGIHNVHPEIVKTLGRLKFRTSYGQNQLLHAKEVALLAGNMAAEMKLDVQAAKRAGLLHDVGKGMTHEHEGTHVELGYRLCKKHNESEIVLNAIRAHHDEEPHFFAETFVVSAADAISGSRPGARREMFEGYVKRLEKLEELAMEQPGVERCFAIQAGRELRVMVEPDKVSDGEMAQISEAVARKIESELQYPGQIKVVVVRETRAIDFAR